jgi:hypothetical protein
MPQVRRLAAGLPPRRPELEPGSGHVGFVVDKEALGQVFSDYFRFPYQLFHRQPHTKHNHHHNHLSAGAGTTSQIVADVPSGLRLTLP